MIEMPDKKSLDDLFDSSLKGIGSFLDDADGDGIKNLADCRPLDPLKQDAGEPRYIAVVYTKGGGPIAEYPLSGKSKSAVKRALLEQGFQDRFKVSKRLKIKERMGPGEYRTIKTVGASFANGSLIITD